MAPGKTQIGVTQPRRVAATSLATRVATELGCPTISPLNGTDSKEKGKGKGKGAGNLVGYSIRFDDRSGYETKIKFMTDGWLLREMVAGGGNNQKDNQDLKVGNDESIGKGNVESSSAGTSREVSSSKNSNLIPQYSILIIDEAHERTIRTDLVLGLAKKIQRERKAKRKEWILKGREKGKEVHELKIVVMSATLDAETFADYFSESKSSKGNTKKSNKQKEEEILDDDDELEMEESKPKKKMKKDSNSSSSSNSQDSSVPILYVKGRQYSVTLNHTTKPVEDFPLAALKTILQIHTSKPPGDILVFMTGQEDIENLVSNLKLYEKDLETYFNKIQKEGGQDQDQETLSSMLILPLYASLGSNASNLIFSPTPPDTRKIVIATNIAETSITIPGIKYVIDSGFCKEKHFDSNSGIESLNLTPISQSNAIQRSGRAGRESEGECFRLYTLKDFNRLNQSVVPEILKSNLESEVLDLYSLGLDPLNFDWIDHPGMDSLSNTLVSLAQLGAISRSKEDGEVEITNLGKQMSSLPISPTSARTLLESIKFGPKVSRMTRDLVSILSSDKATLFSEPNFNDDFKMEEFFKIKMNFSCRSGDHGTFLNVFYSYLRFVKEKERESDEKLRLSLEKDKDGDENDNVKFVNSFMKRTIKELKAECLDWCKRHHVNERTLKEIIDIRKQLIEICETNGIVCDDQPSFKKQQKSLVNSHNNFKDKGKEPDSESEEDESEDEDEDGKESSSKGLSVTKGSGSGSASASFKNQDDLGREETYEEVRKCLLVGRRNRIGMKTSDGAYKVVHGKEVSFQKDLWYSCLGVLLLPFCGRRKGRKESQFGL